MSLTIAALVTGLGLVLALAGVACGVIAYIKTVREHDTLPVWPWADRQLERARKLLRRKPEVRHGGGTVTMLAGHASGTGTAFGALDVIRSDESLDERIRRLEQRVERAEHQMADETARATKAESQLVDRLAEQGRQLNEADEQLRQLTKAVAVSTARLQLLGLILVGSGTALMALPTIAAAL